MNTYRAFGLNILTDLGIIEFLPSSFDPVLADIQPILDMQLNAMEKLFILKQHSYRKHFLKPMGLERTYSKQLMKLAEKVPVEKMSFAI